MRKDHFTTIKIPEGVKIGVEGNLIIIKGKEGENKKIFNMKRISAKQEGEELKSWCWIGRIKVEKKWNFEERCWHWIGWL